MKRAFLLVFTAALVTMMSGCGKSKFESAIAHIDSLQLVLDTCKTQQTIDFLMAEIIKIRETPMYDCYNEDYTKAESDTMLLKLRKLNGMFLSKQMLIWNRDH